ncbi:MAG: AAA family ATPase [Mariprofundales bacterium]
MDANALLRRNKTIAMECIATQGNRRKVNAVNRDAHSIRRFSYCVDVKVAKQHLDAIKRTDDSEHRIKMLENIVKSNGRFIIPSLHIDYSTVLDHFSKRFPNFTPLTEHLRDSVALASLENRPLFSLNTPILLNGPPGIGKSYALSYLANKLGLKNRKISCAESTNGFDVSGLSSGWNNGKPGIIATMLIEEQCANPIIILDELDKTKPDPRSSMEDTLYTLLDSDCAKTFRDEYVDVELDASKINWVATSNCKENLTAPILDRMQVFNIEEPTIDQRLTITRIIYWDMLDENGWGCRFDKHLSDEAVDKLSRCKHLSVRGMQKVLVSAVATAARRNSAENDDILSISMDDISDALQKVIPKPKARMGF